MVDQDQQVLMTTLNKRKQQKFLKNKEEIVEKRKNVAEAIEKCIREHLKLNINKKHE